jgi:hypothetical protein
VAMVAVRLIRPARQVGRETAWPATLVVSWLVMPIVLVALESLVGQSIFTPRNILLCLPAVALLLGWGVVRSSVHPLLAWSVIALLIVLRALVLAPAYGTSPENWRAATAFVLARSHPGDCIAFYPLDGRMPFDYYVRHDNAGGGAPQPVLPAAPWSRVRPYVEQYVTLSPGEIARLPARCPRLWFVSSHEGEANGPPTSRVYHARYEALRAALTRAYGNRATARFGYASVITVDLLAR